MSDLDTPNVIVTSGGVTVTTNCSDRVVIGPLNPECSIYGLKVIAADGTVITQSVEERR